MRWTPGDRSNIEDRRGSAVRGAMPLGIGGLLVLDHRIGADPFGFSQFLVLLAAVHFTVAGFVLLAAIEALRHRRGGRAPLLAGGLAILGGPLTAIGFFGLPGESGPGPRMVCG